MVGKGEEEERSAKRVLMSSSLSHYRDLYSDDTARKFLEKPKIPTGERTSEGRKYQIQARITRGGRARKKTQEVFLGSNLVVQVQKRCPEHRTGRRTADQ